MRDELILHGQYWNPFPWMRPAQITELILVAINGDAKLNQRNNECLVRVSKVGHNYCNYKGNCTHLLVVI